MNKLKCRRKIPVLCANRECSGTVVDPSRTSPVGANLLCAEIPWCRPSATGITFATFSNDENNNILTDIYIMSE